MNNDIIFSFYSPTNDDTDEENQALKLHQSIPGSNNGTSELYLTTGITSTQNTFCTMSKCNSNENDHGDSFDKNNLKSTLDKKNVSGNVNITINQFNEKGTCEQKPLQPNGKISVV